MFEHSINRVSLSWNSASFNQLWRTVYRDHIISVGQKSLHIQKNTIFQSFYYFGRLYNYFSNAVTAQNISGTLFCHLELPCELVYSLEKKISPLTLYPWNIFTLKEQSQHCILLQSSTHPTSLYGLFQTISGPFKQENIPSKRMKTVITGTVPQARKTISSGNARSFANDSTVGMSVVFKRLPFLAKRLVCMFRHGVYFSNNISFNLGECLLIEIIGKKKSQFLQIVKRGLSSHCLHECQDHWKRSLMTVELTSKDVRVCFYNFIRIFLRQKHPPQKPHHPFPRKGFHHLKTDAINSTKGQVPILLNSACIQHLLGALPHARWLREKRKRRTQP